jgi:hypothetical protein
MAGELTMNPAYEAFFARFKEIETLPLAEWKAVHLLAYFCKRYFDHYQISYTFKFNSPSPSKSFEVFKMNGLLHSISKDPTIIKQYIDFFFDKVVIEKKKRFTSISAMTDAKLVNTFKWDIINARHIDRSTSLPAQYLEIAKAVDENIKTFGDLAFVKQASGTNKDYGELLLRLKEAGMKMEDLEKVK